MTPKKGPGFPGPFFQEYMAACHGFRIITYLAIIVKKYYESYNSPKMKS